MRNIATITKTFAVGAAIVAAISLSGVASASTVSAQNIKNADWNPPIGSVFKIPQSQKFHGKRPIHGFYHQGVKMVTVNPNKPQCILHGFQPAPGRPGYCINANQGDPGPGGF